MDIINIINQTSNKKELNSKLLEKARLFNPFSAQFRENPYPIYDRLRKEEPIHKSFMGVWVMTRYKDIIEVLHDDSRFSAKRHSHFYQHLPKSNQAKSPVAQFSDNLMLWLDPPHHTKVRSSTVKVFKDFLMNSLTVKTTKIVDDLWAKLENKKGEIDLVKDLAQPLPVKVIAEIMGIPKEDLDKVSKWSRQAMNFVELNLDSARKKQEVFESIAEYSDYINYLIKERRKNPQSDFISKLVSTNDQDRQLTEEELMSICMLLFPAGERNTSNQIANCLLNLLRFPEKINEIQEKSIPISKVVEELIRYDSSVQGIPRRALEDVKIEDNLIRQGEQVVLMLGAANRDPAQFPNPDQLDFSRTQNNHLAFISGIHNCLGQNLARVEIKVTLTKILPILPNLKLTTDQIDWQEFNFFRSPKHLKVYKN